MTFNELTNQLHNNPPQPNPHFYKVLTSNAVTILQEIELRNQGLVAKDLNISLPKLNHLLPLLKEFVFTQVIVTTILEQQTETKRTKILN